MDYVVERQSSLDSIEEKTSKELAPKHWDLQEMCVLWNGEPFPDRKVSLELEVQDVGRVLKTQD